MGQHANLDRGNFSRLRVRRPTSAQFRGGITWMDFTPCVDCTVSAVIAATRNSCARKKFSSPRRRPLRPKDQIRRWSTRSAVPGYVIRQSDGALPQKGSEENWTGCADVHASRQVEMYAPQPPHEEILLGKLGTCDASPLQELCWVDF